MKHRQLGNYWQWRIARALSANQATSGFPLKPEVPLYKRLVATAPLNYKFRERDYQYMLRYTFGFNKRKAKARS